MTDRRRVNCETGEAATPDLSTKNRTNASILFLQSHIWVERVKQTLRIAATLYLSTENGVNVSIYFCRAISGLKSVKQTLRMYNAIENCRNLS
jgi:hypothetical protein